ncbi:FAD:protein FMN transferase [soil metagenome]
MPAEVPVRCVRRRARRLFAAALVLALVACAPRDEPTRFQFPAFGTLVDIDIYGTDRALANRAAADIESRFLKLHHDWQPWGDGELGAINRAFARGEAVPISSDLARVLDEAMRFSRASNGLFDPGLGGLVRLWGFASDESAPTAPPDPSRIAHLLAGGAGLHHLQVDDARVSSSSELVALDLGGFAKGVAVDRAIARLRAMGVRHAIVNAGGDLRATGRHGDRPWRIGIRHPRSDAVIAELDVLDGESVFTSGDYERYFDYRGRRYHHILDPRTGAPATGAVSVTVLDAQAARADAAATAIFVAGFGGWRPVAAALGVAHVMVVGPDGRIEMTAPMIDRLRLLTQPPAGDAPRIDVRPRR